MSKKMEDLKQRILSGAAWQPEFAAAKAGNKSLPKDDRASDAAIAWRVAKMLRGVSERFGFAPSGPRGPEGREHDGRGSASETGVS